MTNKLLRVTQLDAVHLDNEIYKIFSKIVQECTTYLPPGLLARYESELHLLVKLLILNYSLLKQGRTFGQKLLMIKYENISKTKRILYLILNSLSYIKGKCQILPIRTQMLRLEALITILSFINLSLFLKTGNKPIFTDRLLGLDQVYDRENVQRQFGSKYMTRELLWNGFIEVLMFVLPLINYHKVRRIFNSINPFHTRMIVSRYQRPITTETTCAHCSKPPILPYHMGCAHMFCYTCLKGNQVADARYECPLCEFSSKPQVFERVVAS